MSSKKFSCDKCGSHIITSPQMVGKQVNCPNCRHQITVPKSIKFTHLLILILCSIIAVTGSFLMWLNSAQTKESKRKRLTLPNVNNNFSKHTQPQNHLKNTPNNLVSLPKEVAKTKKADLPLIEPQSNLPNENHRQNKTVPGLNLKLTWIKPGKFLMGSPYNEYGRELNELQHEVIISHGFWCGIYEVKQGEWKFLMEDPKSQYKEDNIPIVLSWPNANLFCQKLTERERSAKRLPEGYIYRLLTEAEWEYCCRAGTTTPFSFGKENYLLWKYGNYCDIRNSSYNPWQDKDHDDGHDKAAPVGSFQANPWGLFDMHGNVWEWCLDHYDKYPEKSVTDPLLSNKNSITYTCRGGSWHDIAFHCRSAKRFALARHYRIGFRIALAPELNQNQNE